MNDRAIAFDPNSNLLNDDNEIARGHDYQQAGEGSEAGNRARTMSNLIKRAKCGICHHPDRAGLGQCTASFWGVSGCTRIYCIGCDGKTISKY